MPTFYYNKKGFSHKLRLSNLLGKILSKLGVWYKPVRIHS